MKKDNSLVTGVVGSILLTWGMIWTIVEAIKGPPYGIALTLAAAGVVAGVITLVVSLRDRPWIML